jgi:superfamily I DNA/RNA helicase
MANVLIGQDFFQSVAGLQSSEKARVIDFVTLFQQNPAHPGISLERVNSAGADLWSGRISQDLRAILFKDGDTWALLHADHHDAAYTWAERKQVGRHSVTGALQIVDLEEVEETTQRVATATPDYRPPGLFDAHRDEYLLSLGVPESWLPTVREVRFEDQLFTVCERLPQDVAERLLLVAGGVLVTPPIPAREAPVEAAEDTQRRFFVASDEDELRAALEAPLERWIAFLHPSQRALVEGSFKGPVKVTGSAGTGKTVVALHRARALARKGHRVLLTSFVTTLCENLECGLDLLCSPQARTRVRVATVHAIALEFVRAVEPRAEPAGADRTNEILARIAAVRTPQYDTAFVQGEWENVVQRQGISEWADYRSARRTGRGRPLSVRERKALWEVFEETRSRLRERSSYTWADLCLRARELIESGEVPPRFDAVVVDEVQDLNAAEIRFLWALAAKHPGHFMVAGDAGQRIYPGGFSLRALGVDVRGRSHILRINYRTTEQIRRAADRLLGDAADDLEGGTETRSGTRSLLRGPDPVLQPCASWDEELTAVAQRIRRWLEEGLEPREIAVFCRTNSRADEVLRALRERDVPALQLTRETSLQGPGVRAGSMHRAKGLEFKAVAVAGCSASMLPHPKTVEGATDPQDREEAIEQERRLLYVAMTRARDELFITWSGAPSPFLEPLLATATARAGD